MSVDVSIVVPVFNEAGNVLPLAREVAAAMQQQPRTYELVFIDDASTDETWQKIQEARQLDPRVRGIKHTRNSGQSAALWTGIQATANPILVTLDGDLQNDPADIPQLLAALAQADFVCGVRVRRQDNWIRRVSTRIAHHARMLVLKVDFQDTGCALRAFKRSTLSGVLPFNGFHRFLPVLIHGQGVRVLEVPVHHRPRVTGVSKYGVRNRLGRGLYDLFAIAWYQKRRLRPVPFTELTSPSPAEPAKDSRAVEALNE